MPIDVALQQSPSNGRFGFSWVNGDVSFDDTCAHEVMSRLVEARAQWWADENGTHGSRLRTIRTLKNSVSTDAEAYAREALQGMVDAKQIAIVRVVVTVLSSQGFNTKVFYSSAGSTAPRTAEVVFP